MVSSKHSRAKIYTDELGDVVCERMGEGENLIDICESLGLKRSTVSEWARLDRDGFYAKYTRARQRQIEYMLDDVLRTATHRKRDKFENTDGKVHINHAAVQRDRLIVDTLKWVACKVVPKMPSFKGTLMEMSNNIINGVEKDGLPVERAQELIKLIESIASIKKVDEFEEICKLIPTMTAKLEQLEREREQNNEVKELDNKEVTK